MAKSETDTAPADPTTVLAAAIAQLAQQLGTSQAQMAETLESLRQNQKPRDINFSDTDYQEKLRAETKVLKRPAYQNGFEVNPSGLSDETIDRLSKLIPGTYLGGVVRVAIDGNDSIHLLYKNKTVEQRFANDRLFPSFTALIDKLWAEMHPAITFPA